MTTIKSRGETLKDIIKAGKRYPKNWKAVFGKDYKNFSNDYYLFHPKTGMYLLKEYQKNPYTLKGVGGKIAKRVDEHVENRMSKPSGDFGIIQGNFKKILNHLKKGVKPNKIMNEAIKGKKDLGIKIPVKGSVCHSRENYYDIKRELADKQKKIDSKFEKIAEEDGLYRTHG
ncbi:MAG: hypothetical protein V5A68_01740 [Candidatus Thermoplasmatota archaeon]